MHTPQKQTVWGNRVWKEGGSIVRAADLLKCEL